MLLGLLLNLISAAVDLVLNAAEQFLDVLLCLIAELLGMILHAFAPLLVAHEISLELLLAEACVALGALDLPRGLEGGAGCALGLVAHEACLLLLVAQHLRVGLVHGLGSSVADLLNAVGGLVCRRRETGDRFGARGVLGDGLGECIEALLECPLCRLHLALRVLSSGALGALREALDVGLVLIADLLDV